MATEAEKKAARKELARRELLRRQREERTDFGDPVVKGGQFQVGGPITMPNTPYLTNLAENTLALTSAAIAEPVAGLAGLARSMTIAPEGSGGQTVRDVREALTYQPRLERSQQNLQGLAELMAPVNQVIETGRRGDEALEAGAPAGIAALYEAIPEMAGGAIGLRALQSVPKPGQLPKVQIDSAGNPVTNLSKKGVIKSDLLNRPERGSTAGFGLDDAGNVVKAKPEKAALSQGWQSKTVSGVRAANNATKQKIREMINIARKRTDEGSISDEVLTRPSDVAGLSLAKRYQYIKGQNQAAGKRLGDIARELGNGGVTVNIDDAARALSRRLQDAGISVSRNPKGKVIVNFNNSNLPKSDRAMIIENMEHIGRFQQKLFNGELNFHDAHQLKQIMRRVGISYEPTLKKQGASPEAQAIFKEFSGKIDEVLDIRSQTYDAQNIKFAETKGVLNQIEKIAKDNLITENPEKQLGLYMRRIMGNPVSRNAIIDMMNDITETANKHGAKFNDDLFVQSFIANDMDDVLRVAGQTSIKGELGPQMAHSLERSSVGNAAHVAENIGRFIGRKSEKKALDTLQALTK